MGSKKKKDTPLCDQIMIFFCCFAGLLCLVCCVPKVPYRYAESYGGFHQRFSMQRSYSLWGATDQLGAIKSWMSLRSETCKKMKELNTQNPLLAAAGQLAGSAVGTGGAAIGCGMWQICKEDVSARCNHYTTVMAIGMVSIVFHVIGAVALFMVPMMVNGEKEFTGKSKKKKKKLAEAVTTTMQVVAAGFFFPMLSYAMYMLSTDSMFHSLSKRAAYPYGYASFGAFMNAAVVVFTLIALVIAWRRWSTTGQESGDEEGSEDESGDMAAASVPEEFTPPEFAPPGMAPPGMGPPGM